MDTSRSISLEEGTDQTEQEQGQAEKWEEKVAFILPP